MPSSITTTTWNLLVSSNLPGVGKSTLWQIASDPEFSKTPEQALGGVYPALAEFDRRGSKFDLAVSRAKMQVERAEGLGIKIVGFYDAQYPPTLRHASSAPALFWYKGDERALQQPLAAVIGTRHPTEVGAITAQRIATALALGGVCVVSGLALGVDAAAHEACVIANAATIAVLPGGLDNIAPRTNAPLAERIIQSGGGLLSEFPIGMPSMPANFVTRDATQAALSLLVVLVQSDRTGGSMHASRAAVKLKRKLVVAAPTRRDVDNGEPKIEGNLAFINDTVRENARMGFPTDVMKYVQILRSRADYPELVKDIAGGWSELQAKRRAGVV